MKQFLLSLFSLTTAYFSLGQSKVCVLTTNNLGNTVTVCSPTSLGSVSPCASLSFIVTDYLPAPNGYVNAAKFEWFVNGVSVKITTDPSDPVLIWTIKESNTSVYCKVSFRDQSDQLVIALYFHHLYPGSKSAGFSGDNYEYR